MSAPDTETEIEDDATETDEIEPVEKPAEPPKEEGGISGTQIAVGLGVVGALAAGGYFWWKRSREREAAIAEKIAEEAKAREEAEAAAAARTAIFRKAPYARVDTSHLPMLALTEKGTPGGNYWVLGDENAPFLATALQSVLGDIVGNELAAAPNEGMVPSLPSKTVLFSMLTPLLTNKQRPDAAVWLVSLGPNQEPVNVEQAKESIQKIRAAIGPQRVLWVLSATTDPSLAEALTASAEEWVRTRSDDPALGSLDAANTIAAPDKNGLDAAIPPSK